MEPNLLPTLFQNLTQAIQISAEAQQNAARELATQRAQSQKTIQFMQHHLEQQRIQYLTDVRSLNELHATNLNQAFSSFCKCTLPNVLTDFFWNGELYFVDE